VTSAARTLLTVGVGDIHGRFHRVQQWISQLEEARRREVDVVFAVGDVEAFESADDHRRKAAKRSMPAEFAEFVAGGAKMQRPLYFIGGNNEDFGALHGIPEGGELVQNVHYLGRAGVREIQGLQVAYLSGIYAPKHFDTPLLEPRTQQTAKQAGYFRLPEIDRFHGATATHLMLVHEWPKGLLRRPPPGATRKPLRAYRFPWIGNIVTRQLVEVIKPAWLMCGHSHVPLSTTLSHPDGSVSRVACLDQAARPEAAILWTEWQDGRAVRAGWGVSGAVSWREGEPFSEQLTPDGGDDESASDAM
jgi:lariat debranching enzyme